jgi:predicted dienelactone hydrolase
MNAMNGVCLGILLVMPVVHAEDAVHAGYREFTLEQTEEKGAKRNTSAHFWYPTLTSARPFDYQWVKGFAAENAPVAPGRHPLIIFSHGYHGVADQTVFLKEALARAGYMVASANHADALFSRRGPRERPNFVDPESWTDAKFADRREDVKHLLDHLLALDAQDGSFLHMHVDRNAIGGTGHSLGGYTMLSLAGAWPSWHDKRIRAVLLLSPYVQPFLTNGELAEVSVPVMLQGGTLDFGITPFLPRAYHKLNAPKYFLTLERATHFEWTNLLLMTTPTIEGVKSGNAKLITNYSIAFFDRHLRNKQGSSVLDAKDNGLAHYEHVK